MLAACGGSQNRATSASITGVTSPATASTTGTGRSTTTHTRHVSPRDHRAKRRAIAASDVRLPATYLIHPGGELSPPAISAPTSVDIVLTVISEDGRGHRVRLRSPGEAILSVPAGGRASALIGALKRGSYAIDVDGVPRGQLVIGVSPGP